jgi:Protein of unknown function (DUF2934)
MSAMAKKSKTGKGRSSSSSSASGKPIELPEGTWERIRAKAHELWEARGRREGGEMQDWLDAEEIVMEEIHEARE